jgi:hypothetical protein
MVLEEDSEVVEMMSTYGGSFVKALAECLHRADHINYRKLKETFSEYFEEYEKMIADKK